MNIADATILDHLTTLADPTRTRILLLLERHELPVSDLCAIMQLPQSTVSRHLKALADSGWVGARAEGTSHLYTMTRRREGVDAGGHAAAAESLWALVREEAATSPAAAQDRQRLQSVLAKRRVRSQEFFATSAGQWDRYRDELFGSGFHLSALGALACPEWVVGDLGCGTGRVSAALAPFVARVIAVDASSEMLRAARLRLSAWNNVELRQGDLETLPIDDETLDAALLTLVLHHAPDPSKTLAEVTRVLKPGGLLWVVDMTAHDREGYRQQMGHVWLGFAEAHVRTLLSDAGLAHLRVVPLTPDPEARGPGLFVATGSKPPAPEASEARR